MNLFRLKLKEKKSAKHTALEYFDFFYSSTFGNEWNKIRLAMLTGSKYAAMLNNYSSNHVETLQQLQSLAALDLFEFSFRHKMKSIETSSATEDAKKRQLDLLLKFKNQPLLKLFTFDNGDTRFVIDDELKLL